MPLNERMHLLQASVDIIQLSHVLAVDHRISDSLWYFRGFVQWHCLAVVVAELGWNPNQSFSNTAWAILDPMLADWDAVYESKKEEPAWHYVNSIIERARSLRRQSRPHAATKSTVIKFGQTPDVCMLSDRAASTNTPAMTTYPIRTATNTAAMQSYAAHVPQTQHRQREILGFQQQPPTRFQQTHMPQYQTVDSYENTPYAVTGASNSFDFGGVNGFDDIDFSAFDEVFSSASWTQFNVTEHHESQPYESIAQNYGCGIAPPG